MSNTPSDKQAPEPTWRSDKAHEAICEAAEAIANHYCSEDDTYNLEVKRLTVAISDVVDSRARVPSVVATDERLKTYADGFCAQCSELAYPLTRALEKTGVPTGADNWQQTYGPNKVQALADLETCLRRLLNALEEGKPEDIKERISRANHYIELHATIRRRLTALAQRGEDTAVTEPIGAPDDPCAVAGFHVCGPGDQSAAIAAAEEIWKRIDSEHHLTLPNKFEIVAIIQKYCGEK